VTVDVFDVGLGRVSVIGRRRRRGVGAAAGAAALDDEGVPAMPTDRLWANERRLEDLAVSSFLRKQLDLKGDKPGEGP
jgi:hypothetical protein